GDFVTQILQRAGFDIPVKIQYEHLVSFSRAFITGFLFLLPGFLQRLEGGLVQYGVAQPLGHADQLVIQSGHRQGALTLALPALERRNHQQKNYHSQQYSQRFCRKHSILSKPIHKRLHIRFVFRSASSIQDDCITVIKPPREDSNDRMIFIDRLGAPPYPLSSYTIDATATVPPLPYCKSTIRMNP